MNLQMNRLHEEIETSIGQFLKDDEVTPDELREFSTMLCRMNRIALDEIMVSAEQRRRMKGDE